MVHLRRHQETLWFHKTYQMKNSNFVSTGQQAPFTRQRLINAICCTKTQCKPIHYIYGTNSMYVCMFNTYTNYTALAYLLLPIKSSVLKTLQKNFAQNSCYGPLHSFYRHSIRSRLFACRLKNTAEIKSISKRITESCPVKEG